jgi:hypothetical protein
VGGAPLPLVLAVAVPTGKCVPWPAREDVAIPAGFRHVRQYPNTSPAGFREFMCDRARAERLKGIFENYIGPVLGENPNTLDM